MDIKEQEYQNGTLLYFPLEGLEVGMFVGHPDMDDRKPLDPEHVLIGSPLDFVVRKRPTDEWDEAPRELGEGIVRTLAGMDKNPATEPIGRNEGAADGVWTKDAMHRVILTFMKRALTTFVAKRLN